jgi:NAD(P)-dependent dehydrogenase (short-subunit alcohol dehydrogenase family)
MSNSMSDPFTLIDQTILVTGGGGGIGADIARQLARAGATVIVHYRHSGRVKREELNLKIHKLNRLWNCILETFFQCQPRYKSFETHDSLRMLRCRMDGSQPSVKSSKQGVGRLMQPAN